MNKSTPEVGGNSLPAAPRKFRLGIRHFLCATLYFSALSAILFTFPPFLVSICVITLALILGAVFTSAIVYGSTNVRAFSIGAMFPISLMLTVVGVLFVVLTYDVGYSNSGGDYALEVVFGKVVDELDDYANTMRFVMVAGTILVPITGTCSWLTGQYLQKTR